MSLRLASLLQQAIPETPGGTGGPFFTFLKELAAESGSAPGIPPLNYTVFVGKNGNDATADGSIAKPFLTVRAAMEYAWATYVQPLGPQPVQPFTRPCVFVAAGTYTNDGPFVLPPQICVMGEGYNHTRIQGNWTIDGRWGNPPADDMRSSWINLGLFGNIDVDFAPMASNEGKLYAFGVRFAGTVTIAQKIVNPSSNQLIFTACEFLGDVTLKGIPANLDGCTSFGATLTLEQQTGTGVDNIFASNGGSLGAIVINATSNAPDTPPYAATLGHSVQPGAGLTINGAFSTVRADASALPLQSLITLSSGASLAQVQRTNQPFFSGPTADRNPYPYTGETFFDTTIVRPIWWSGVSWIDAAGNPV